MTPDAWAAIISLIGVVVSVLASAFVVGFRWGKIEGKLDDVNSRLRTIEKLFTLKLRKEVEDSG